MSPITVDIINSASGDKKAPIIDADANMLKELDKEYLELYDRKQEINRDFQLRLEKEIEPIVLRMRENRVERARYEPKPLCFATKDACELKECEVCKYVPLCVKAARIIQPQTVPYNGGEI